MEKWIHRRCAYETDGLVRPKEYAREVELCFRCGEGLENSVRGPLYLYEVGEEVESILPQIRPLPDVETLKEIALIDTLPHLKGESIPFKIEPEITVVITPKVVKEVHTVGGNEFAEIEDEVQSEDAAIPEEVDAAEQPTDGDVNVTEDEAAQIRAQIAELEAKLKEAPE